MLYEEICYNHPVISLSQTYMSPQRGAVTEGVKRPTTTHLIIHKQRESLIFSLEDKRLQRSLHRQSTAALL